MNKLRRMLRREKEFAEFAAEVTTFKNGYKIKYRDGTQDVSWMFGDTFENYYTVAWINIFDGYKRKGYAKFMYRDALELAKENGLEGLLVGDSMRNEKKARSIYSHFQARDHWKRNSQRQYLVILYEWNKPQKKTE